MVGFEVPRQRRAGTGSRSQELGGRDGPGGHSDILSQVSEHQLARRNQEFYAVSAARDSASVARPSSSSSSSFSFSTPGASMPPQTSEMDRGSAPTFTAGAVGGAAAAAVAAAAGGLVKARPSSGRRIPLVPIDDEETQRLERAQGAVLARRLLDRDRAAAVGAGASGSGSAGAGPGESVSASAGVEPGGAQRQHTRAGPEPGDTLTRKVAALRAGGYLPTPETPETDAQVSTPDGGGGSGGGGVTTGGSELAGVDAASPTTPTTLTDVDPTVAAAKSAAAAAGVPMHLMDHLHVPDKEVFELKAKVNALSKQLQTAEDQRDEALRVAATADARAKASNANAAKKLDKVRARAEAAERAAGANELRAEVSEKSARAAKQRAAAMEAELEKQTNLVAQLQEQIEEQRAIGLALEDDVEVLRRRVLEHERGVTMFSRSSQTAQEDLEAAARARGPDAPDAANEDGFRAKANAWLRDLEGVGADVHVDGSGEVHRASARPPLAPRGLGRDLPLPAEPHLGAAGYSLAAAVAEVAVIIEHDLVPAVDRMFQRQLPLREEIRALVEDEVMPLVEPTIAVMQQGPLPFTTEQEFEEPAPYRVPGQPLPLSWILADREAEDAQCGWDGTEPVGIAFSGPEGMVDEGWGPDVDSDEEVQESQRERTRIDQNGVGAARGDAGAFTAQLLLKGKMNAGAAAVSEPTGNVPGAGGLAGAIPSLLKQKDATDGGGGDGALGGGAAKLASLFGSGKDGTSGAAGTDAGGPGAGGLGMMAALKAAKWAAKVKTRARAKRGTKVEASLLRAKEEGRLMEHIKGLMVKAKNAPNDALRKKLRNYIADVVHTAVEDGILKIEEAKNITAGRAPHEDAFDASGSGEAGGWQEEEQQWDGGDEGNQETEYSEGDDAYLYDNYGSEYAHSDHGDDGGDGGGWEGDDPSWQSRPAQN